MQKSHSEPTNNLRQSNLELLRIVAMLMVILVHFAGHGGGIYLEESPQKYQAMALNLTGQVGVNVFMLISGYYMCEKRFTIRRLFKIALQVFFYSVAVGAVLAACGAVAWDAVLLKGTFFPLYFGQYWFASEFVLVYVLSPLLNAFARQTEKRPFLLLLGLLFIIISVLPVINQYRDSALSHLLLIYLIGAYIRKFDLPVLKKPLGTALAFAGGCGALYAVTRVLHWRWGQWPFQLELLSRDTLADQLTVGYAPWILALSVLLFLTFKNLRLPNSRAVNLLAGAAFGVYLIHDHPLLRPILWGNIVGTDRLAQKWYYLPAALGTAAAIYLICAAVDIARQYALERPVLRLYGRAAARLGRSRKDTAAQQATDS